MRLLVVRCLTCAVVQALMRARVNAGALCLTGAASYALTGEIDSAGAFAGADYVERYLMRTLERSVGRSVGQY